MPNFQRSHVYTPFTPSASPVMSTAFPVTLVAEREYPHYRARSTSLVEQHIYCDFGSVLTIEAVALFYLNFTSFQLAHGASVGGAFTPLPGSPFTAGRQPVEGGTIRGCVVSSFTNRVLRVTIPAQATTDGASVFKIGLIEALRQWTTFIHNPEPPLDFEPTRPVFSQDIGAHRDVVNAGPLIVSLDLSGKWESLVDVQALLTLGPATPFVLFRNRGNASEVYFFRIEGGRYGENFPLSTASLRFREVI